MAATVTIDPGDTGRFAAGDKFIRVGNMNIGVYATNGVPVTKQMFDLPVRIDHLEVDNGGGYIFEFDKANLKVKAYRDNSVATAAALPEIANAVDITTTTIRFRATGK
jgi:hypothetical protein